MPNLSQAAGRVVTGYSKPYVALYTVTGTGISYEMGRLLARGVSVEVAPESSDAQIFYADNSAAETAPGRFTGGEVTLTVDGLLMDAEKMIMGLPAPGDSGFTEYGDNQNIPYVGVGWITRYMSGGVTVYVPEGLTKVAFNEIETSAETQEEEIDFQTQELTATILRGDDANHTWKFKGQEYATEAAADAALRDKLHVEST
jgi:phi13 family phage major tail protein